MADPPADRPAPIDPEDILVVVGHPHGDVEVPLTQWIETGPGPRPFVQLRSARRRSTGEPVPLDQIDDPWRRDPPTYPGPPPA
jgi:hypothetical protein